MAKPVGRMLPVTVVDNPTASAMPGAPIMSGGLGGAVAPNSEIVPNHPPRVGTRALTFMQALQFEIRKDQIDLSGVNFTPFVRDLEDSPHFYLLDPSEIVDRLENAIIEAAIQGRNSTQISNGIGGGAKRVLFANIKKIIRWANAGKINIVGVNANPSGNQRGRPGKGSRF